ncbi:MAG: class I SAM-dependent methyltransferase [Candidatus Hodarchaeota archaeon]
MEPTKRFSSKAEYFNKYRPRYPDQIIKILEENIGLLPQSYFKIADIGSGTGILSKLFLKHGNTVYGVEPNKEMREVAERVLKTYKNFISVDGQAESTNIEEKVDAITAGQSFHWFDIEKARKEFLRILKPGGYVILIWNQRKGDSTSFGKEIEQILLEYGTDYKQVTNHERTLDFHTFYGSRGFQKRILQNVRTMTFNELQGRILSISCVPDIGDSRYPDMIHQLKKVFSKYQVKGKIVVEFETELYFGQLAY